MKTQITLNTNSKPVTKYPSVAAWATALGSTAKTHAGQRRALIASFARNRSFARIGRMVGSYETYHPGSSLFPPAWERPFYSRKTKAEYLAQQEADRQERFAASHPLTLSMPAPATKSDCEGDNYQTHEVSVEDLQALRTWNGFARVGEWYVRCQEDVSYDNNRYSKGWHRQHGGAKTVDARRVLIRRVRPDGTLETRDQSVEAWRGNYLLDALIRAGVAEAHKGLNNIRLHSAFDVQIVRQSRSLSIYERTLGGTHIDLCAERDGVTYHARTISEAIAGLRKKINSQHARGSVINTTLGRKLGFCESGMRGFAQALDLDIHTNYTPQQIEQAVRANPRAAEPYRSELVTLAKAVNYPIPNDLA